MRQINIKELNKHLSRELSNIPFEVVRYGKVIGVMISPEMLNGTDLIQKGTDLSPKTESKGTDLDKSGSDHIEKARQQLTEIVKRKQKVLTTKSTIDTGKTTWINPLAGTKLAPKA